MSIRVNAYTSGGMASGILARPGRLRDALEVNGSLPLDRANWQAIDDERTQAAGSMTIPSDDVIIAVADDDPGVPVHAAWHHIHVESGPYTIEGELATLPGFDPGRALTRPTGEFVLLRDIRLSVRARPEASPDRSLSGARSAPFSRPGRSRRRRDGGPASDGRGARC